MAIFPLSPRVIRVVFQPPKGGIARPDSISGQPAPKGDSFAMASGGHGQPVSQPIIGSYQRDPKTSPQNLIQILTALSTLDRLQRRSAMFLSHDEQAVLKTIEKAKQQ